MQDSRGIRAPRRPFPTGLVFVALGIFCAFTSATDPTELFACTEGKYRSDGGGDVIDSISIEDCAQKCLDGTPAIPEFECSSFDYKRSDQRCTLSTGESGSLLSHPDYWYCEKKDFLNFFVAHRDHELPGLNDITVIVPEATARKCALQCVRDQATLPGAICHSFEMRTEQRPDECILSSDSMETTGLSLHYNTGFNYYQRTELCIPNPCVQGSCMGMNNIFTCNCDSGWGGDVCDTVCDEGTFGSGCTETCHCALGTSVCDNTNGICSSGGCAAGWTGPGCQDDVNECVENGGRGPCEQICTNTRGSYTCSCRDGYSLNDDGHACDDVCVPNPCVHGSCTRLASTFTCMCDAGWEGDICDKACGSGTFGHGCSSTCHCAAGNSVCATDTGACSSGGCIAGWEGVSCQTDIDECHSNSGRGPCAQICTNTPGHYTCSCSDGHHVGVDGHTCEACWVGTFGPECSGTCHCALGHAVCEAETGSCSSGGCEPGWTGPNCQTACQPGHFGVDCTGTCHCASGASVCYSQSGVCSSGGCVQGWEGRNCHEDIDECNSNNHVCNTNAKCTNTAGSFSCSCNAGYQGDGVSCSVIEHLETGSLGGGGIAGISIAVLVVIVAIGIGVWCRIKHGSWRALLNENESYA
ncbi:MEGF10 [Branchiostoma lanceolatum]|uniref:MEGF10 protein n=1 Tax=Branchiostoma lanceolatum TaxID=7740 RepID=A0A8J9ZJZ3_BRALA|nr:MEGF10 [Branchiostoma lanceolatum]